MPGKFNLIDVDGNEAAIDKLIRKVEEAIPVFNNMQRSINDVNNSLRNGTPRDYVNSLQEVARLNRELAQTNNTLANSERDLARARNESLASQTNSARGRTQGNDNVTRSTNQLTDAERRLAQAERQLSIQRSEQAPQIARVREETNRLTASNRDAAREQLRLEGLSARERARLGNTVMLYNAVQQKMNKLQNEYKNLALAKQLGMSLTDKEVQRMEYLEKRIQRYDQALKAVDASMGRHHRSVGNYASGFNSLNNSVAQIAREMPAFTYSIQTGFMAISNNLPIFFDSMRAAREQNAALRAEGKATTPVWKQLGAALFSWNTLLSIGITLLTVYGKEIGDWIKKMLDGNSATSMLRKNTEDLNKARQEGAKSAASEISTLETLYRVATNENASKEARIRAINKLQSLYPSFFKNLSDEAIMVGNAKDKYLELRAAILDSARARAIGTILEKRQEEQLLKEEAVRKKLSEAINTGIELDKNPKQTKSEYVRDGQGGLILKEVSNNELSKRNNRVIFGYQMQLQKLGNDFVALNKSLIDQKSLLENKSSVLAYEGDKYGKSDKIKKPPKDKASSLTAEQKDYIKNLEANRDTELSINTKFFNDQKVLEDEYFKNSRKNGEAYYKDGVVTEEQYLLNILSINNDFYDAKIKYLKGKNAEERKQIADAQNDKVNAEKEINAKLYDLRKKDIDSEYKNKQKASENALKLISENQYITETERVAKQLEIYNQSKKDTAEYWDNLINIAEKSSKTLEDINILRNEKDNAISTIDTNIITAQGNLPEALKKDLERQQEITENNKTVTYEKQKQAILSNKMLSDEERSYRLSLLQIENEIKKLEIEKEKLLLRNAVIAGKAAIGQPLTQAEQTEFASNNAAIAGIDTQIKQSNNSKDKLNLDEFMQKAAPAIDAIKASLSDLGLDRVSAQFEEMFRKIKDGSFSTADAIKLGVAAIADVSTKIIDETTNKRISELDKQLEYARNNSDQEIEFLQGRIDQLNSLEELTAEQEADRRAMEDEQRALREQQAQREKQIEAQKARAEQKAAAQKALINGALGATMALATQSPPASYIMAALALAFGVAQSAAIMSKDPVPKYFVGTDYARKGLAWTDERGAEIHTDRHGNIKDFGSSDGARLKYLDEGDKIFTAEKSKTMMTEMFKAPEMQSGDYLRIAMRSIHYPLNIKNEVNIDYDLLSDKIAQKQEAIARKYTPVNTFEVEGYVYMQEPGKLPKIVDKVRRTNNSVRNAKD